LRGVKAGGCDTSKIFRISAVQQRGTAELLGAAQVLARGGG
jgi:hypothetical protein